MSLEICPHTNDHKQLIWNVYQFYCYDTSTEDEYDLEENGLYSISAEYFAQYWTDPGWSAHLLRWDGVIAGFALIEASEALKGAQELADLFVLKRFRRRGIAREVTLHFMAQRTVPWTIVVFDEAKDAQAFWRSMFTESQLQPARQVADPDDRAVIVHVLEANRTAA
jgi:predicted acetyltransferase